MRHKKIFIFRFKLQIYTCQDNISIHFVYTYMVNSANIRFKVAKDSNLIAFAKKLFAPEDVYTTITTKYNIYIYIVHVYKFYGKKRAQAIESMYVCVAIVRSIGSRLLLLYYKFIEIHIISCQNSEKSNESHIQ